MSIHKRETTRGARYDVRLRDPEGRTYTRTFRTKDDAKVFERAELTARDRGLWIDTRLGSRTFRELAADWLASNPAKKASTLAAERSLLEGHVLPDLGPKTVRSITPRDVQAIVNDLAGKMAPRSVRRIHSTMRAIGNYAVATDHIARNPVRGIKLPATVPTEVHVFTPEELVSAADALPAEYRPMVWLGAVLGMRWQEVAALQMGALDLLGRTLAVERAVVRGANGRPDLGEPKSDAGRRTLAMPAALAQALAAHAKAIGVTAADPDALLFPAPDGGLLRYSNWLRRAWWPAMVTAGLGSIEKDDDGRPHYMGPGFHDLRRTSATALVVDGVDVKTAQYRLGHSSPVLTLELYAQAVTAAERDASERVGARLMSAG
jgi:integrase